MALGPLHATLLASRTGERTHPCDFQPPSVWSLVNAAQGNTSSVLFERRETLSLFLSKAEPFGVTV